MAAFVFALSPEDSSNWEICKAQNLIGVRQGPQGISTARQVRSGDAVYVWGGGGPGRRSGLIAQVTVTGSAREAHDPPWPDPSSYSYVIPIALEEELPEPIADSFPGNRKGVRFGIQNTDLQKGLRPVDSESESALSACFGSTRPPDLSVPVPVSTEHGWSSDQDLIRAVEHAAVQATHIFLTDQHWTQLRDCQRDGCGYDFVYQHVDGRQRIVEVKGTSGPALRFVLTRLEHQVLSRDPSARIYCVTDALGSAEVHELDWTDVEDLGCSPSQWQVGRSTPESLPQ